MTTEIHSTLKHYAMQALEAARECEMDHLLACDGCHQQGACERAEQLARQRQEAERIYIAAIDGAAMA